MEKIYENMNYEYDSSQYSISDLTALRYAPKSEIRKYGAEKEMRQRVVSEITRFCETTGERILDAGCGTGNITLELIRRGKKVTGVDISRNTIERTRKMYKPFDFQYGDMRELPFNDSLFDGIWCYRTFLMIPPEDQLRTLKEFRRVIKPEGKLLLNVKSIWNPRCFWEALKEKAGKRSISFGEVEIGGTSETYRFYTTSSRIEGKIRESGFRIMKKDKWKRGWITFTSEAISLQNSQQKDTTK